MDSLLAEMDGWMIISRWLCTSDAAALAASRVASTARALVRPLPRAHEIEGHLVRAPPGRVATPPTTTGSVHAPLATQHHHRPLATSPVTYLHTYLLPSQVAKLGDFLKEQGI